MRAHLLLSFLFAPVILADLVTLQTQLAHVNAALQELDNTTKGLSTAGSAQTLLVKVNALADVLKTATTSIQKTEAVSLTEAMSLQSSASSILNNIKESLANLAQKAPLIKEGGQSANILTVLNAQVGAAQNLGTVVIAKMPFMAQGLVKSAFAQVTSALTQGIATFQGNLAKRDGT